MNMNRSETVEKSSKKQYHKSGLTPLKKRFAQEFARTDNATQALLTAYGDKPITYGSAGVAANRLLKNDNVSREIEYQKGKLEQLASRAVDRVEKLIESDNEQVATANAWKTIEQVQGKAVQQIKTENTSVNVVVTLK
jgi:phage terminase small subunit